MDLCACSVVDSECRWSCVRGQYNTFRWNYECVHSFIMIFGGIVVVFSSLL